ncbi:MAG TPA: MOSC N-terminal beta barrel domain-containing protein [Thermoanaerobaculia bacterium]|jgi:hypothetical protein|nr:MOSC N-terminal beta barrel domain-containing protein [Thermoanaerobaculia bacterium]
MWISALWRYPVKSMAGERLERAELLPDGIAGDRRVQVLDTGGRVVTARTRPGLLGHRGTLDPAGEPLVDGRPWRSAAVARDVEAAAGPGAHLSDSGEPRRFDVLPLLVATDGALAAFGHDLRRLRPNLVIGGVPGLAERDWEGRRLRIGDIVVVGLEQLRQRCVMTTFDPDTQEQDVEVFNGIQRDFGGLLALNAYVVEGGTLAVGDPVELAG